MQTSSRRNFLKQAGAIALSAGAALSGQSKRPLNFVFILADDWGWTDLGCYGSRYYETPNIDRLASQGMRFTNAYASCPVCSPTRASILTGRYPARLHLTDWIPGRRQWSSAKLLTPSFHQELPLQEVTIAEMLKTAGYGTGSIGKWHLGGEAFSPEKQGFDLNIAGTHRGSPASYFGPFNLPGLHNSRSGDYLTELLTQEALRFIGKNQNHPFFLYFSHFAVHTPLQAKPESIAKYKAKTNPATPQHNPIYAAMVESLDQSVGAVLKKLEELGLNDNTVVFLTSDNGGLLYEGKSQDNVTSNRPLRAGKGHLYEGGIREPLIIRWPGVTIPGSVCHAPVSSVDFLPTIQEIAGVPSAKQVDGASLVPVLRNPEAKLPREDLYWHYPHYSNQGGLPGGAIRSGGYKLIEFYEDGKLELYHLPTDIGERSNLAAKEPERVKKLHTRLQQWRDAVKADMPRQNPSYDATKADQGLYGTSPTHQ